MNTGIDYRTDYYSLGITIYEMICGDTPFSDAKDEMEIIHSQITRMPIPLYELRSDVPKFLSGNQYNNVELTSLM
jgi:serine/threonine protein kinase